MMDARAAELHVSALSPAEYNTYKRYLDLLALAQAREGVAALGADGTVRFDRTFLRSFAAERLGVPRSAIDDVLSRVVPGTPATMLSAGQVYAVFRMLAHVAATGVRKGPDIELVFVPVEPLPLDPEPDLPPPAPPRRVASMSGALGSLSTASSSSSVSGRRRSRPSLPPRRRTPSPTAPSPPLPPRERPARKSLPAGSSLDPFRDTDTPSPTNSPAKSRAYSTSSLGVIGSNNPFRGAAPATAPPVEPVRSMDSPSAEPLRSVGPPLPPRKPSMRRPGPALPPRARIRADSFSSDTASDSIHQPTSTREASPLMQQSFAAAANRDAQARRANVPATIQVLRSSEFPPRHDEHPPPLPRRDLVEQVNRAIRESEVDLPPPPPQRVVSGARPKPPTPSPATASAAFTLATEQARAKYPGLKTWPHVGLLSDRPARPAFAVIILNQPITRRDTLMRVWYASTLRYCADGGANRLYDALDPEERERMLPTMIKGDLDSIRPDVKAYYASRGVAIKRDPSEYATDLQKNMEEVEAIEKTSGKNFSLVFLGGLSGRLDQTLHVLSTLFKLREKRRNTYVISEESLAWVLDTGVHLIEVDHSSMGQTCGILPVGGEAHVRTEGLKWNLDWVTSVMGELSTSNHLLPHENAVLVETSAPIVWTVEIRQGLQTPPLRSPPGVGVEDISRGVKELGRAVGKGIGGIGSIGQGFNRRLSRQGLGAANGAGADEVSRERERERNREREGLVGHDSDYAERYDGEADGYAQLD